MSKTRAFLENVVIVAIVLVLIQTLFDDVAVLAGWPWAVRLVLLFVGLGLDIFFTVEFLARLYGAYVNRRAALYFFYERGWIDFIASIPVLLLISGPAALAYWSGSAMVVGTARMINVLKVVKAIRIARVLRLLRFLKIFARISHTESAMAQRHVARIATIAVTVIIAGALVLNVGLGLLDAPGLEHRYQHQMLRLIDQVQSHDLSRATGVQAVEELATVEDALLLVQVDGRTVYSRHDTPYYETYFGLSDYGFSERQGVRVFFDVRPFNQHHSRSTLVYLLIIVALIVWYILYYTPHFVLTISDPVHIMSRGMSEKGYNLEVKVPVLYRTDEIYRLGRLYNDVYLPLKRRASSAGDGVEDAVDG